MSLDISRLTVPGYSDVLRGADPRTGYVGFVAAHSTGPTPALGGTRMMSYAREADALADVLRLAAAMSLKVWAANLPARGGKAVILYDAHAVRDDILRSHAELVNYLGGAFTTAVDVGTDTNDMQRLHEWTPYVTSLNVGPWTARGVLFAIQSALAVAGKTLAHSVVAVQGCGQVGLQLVEQLRTAGSTVYAADVHPEAARAAASFGAHIVDAAGIHAVECDVFAPCALGGVLTHASVIQVRSAAIAGAANNQLSDNDVANALHTRGILYVPDFVANAGGVISGFAEMRGHGEERTARDVRAIGLRTDSILARAAAQHCAPLDIVMTDLGLQSAAL